MSCVGVFVQGLHFKCDGCGWTTIVTWHWHCDICLDLGFCEVCHSFDNHEHPMTNTFLHPMGYITINTFEASNILLSWKRFSPQFDYNLWSLYKVIYNWLQHLCHIESHGQFMMWIESKSGSSNLFNFVT